MKEVVNVALATEGLNTVEVPKGGVILSVVIGGGYAPALAVLAERAAATEAKSYFVTRQHVGDVDLGEYIGSAQDAGSAAMHVFEAGAAKAEANGETTSAETAKPRRRGKRR